MKNVCLHNPQKIKYLHALVVETKDLLKRPDKFQWREHLRKYCMVIVSFDYLEKNIKILDPALVLHYSTDIIYIHPDTYESIYETYHYTLPKINELLTPTDTFTTTNT